MKKLLTIVAIAIGAYFVYAPHLSGSSATTAATSAAPAAERLPVGLAQNNTALDRASSAPVAALPPAAPSQNSAALDSAFANHLSNIRVQGQGQVTKVLPDDNDGSRHQRFIVRLSSGQNILIAHNIDLAPRVSSLSAGDAVEFKGEYAWNARGGVVHWTHRDPAGHHAAGWLRHNGQTVQ